MNMETNSTSKMALLASMGLVTGNLIGAGILALPISLGLSGMGPSLVMMVVYGALMFFSAVVLAREATAVRDTNFDFPSLYKKYLGSFGKWVAVVTNMIILYGLLTAYISGGSKILASLFNLPGSPLWLLLIFAAGLIVLTSLNLSLLQKYNIVLVLILAFTFVVIVVQGEQAADFSRLKYADWQFLPATIPLVVTSFHFHNIIPTLCGDLQWKSSLIWKAMLGGMIIAFIMNAVWVQTGISALPLSEVHTFAHNFTDSFESLPLHEIDTIHEAYECSVPATVPMSNMISSKSFMVFATVFAMVAIITSFLANGIGLQSFIRDILYNTFKVNKKMLTAILTFTPPLVVAVLWPDIFLRAIDIVGGIGIVTLFGVLPCIIAIIKKSNPRWMRVCGGIFLLLSLFALTVEVTQEFGITELIPNAETEYWKHNAHKLNQAYQGAPAPVTPPAPVK